MREEPSSSAGTKAVERVVVMVSEKYCKKIPRIFYNFFTL
jgi:hypothetical protein